MVDHPDIFRIQDTLASLDLQTKMASENLGKAIQDLGGPNVKAKNEAKKANKQANADVSAAMSAS